MNLEKVIFKKESLKDKESEKTPQGNESLQKKEERIVDEEILTNREKVKSKNLGGGLNKTIFIELKDDGSGVFKPKNGEQAGLRSNTEAGTYYNRERAAYLVDKFLDLELVPTTVIREIDGDIGSVQRFIPDAELGGLAYFKYSHDDEAMENIKIQLMKMWIFDCIIYNADRYGDNWIFADNKVFAIDNGLSFGKSRLKVQADFYDMDLPNELIQKFKEFFADIKKQKELNELLTGLLSEEEVEAFFIRLNRVGKLVLDNKKISKSDWGKIISFN